MNKVIKKLWESTTLTTWSSYLSLSGNILVVLPLILAKFSAAEVALYYLLTSIAQLSGIVDVGFRNTFIRLFAFATGNAKDITVIDQKPEIKEEEKRVFNWILIEDLYSMMMKIYVWVSLLVLVLLLLFGTLSLVNPIDALTLPNNAWIAWGVVCITAPIEFYGKSYKNYLEGLYEVALVRRAETVFNLGAIISGILVMVFIPSLLSIIITERLWKVINVIRDWYLAHRVHERRASSFISKPFDKELFKKIWAPAWRSGVSGMMSNGLSNISGILFAQVGATVNVASYLLALRLITLIRNISNAPFYSKIPLLARLRASGVYDKLIKISQKEMSLVYILFLLGAAFVGVFSDYIILILGSDTQFVSLELWWLLALAFFIHRMGTLHLQLYLTTNHVISHIIDGISGIIFILTSYLMLEEFGVYAFVWGMLLGYTAVQGISIFYSYKSLKIEIGSFIKQFLVIPIIILFMFIYLAFSY